MGATLSYSGGNRYMIRLFLCVLWRGEVCVFSVYEITVQQIFVGSDGKGFKPHGDPVTPGAWEP